MDKNNAFHIVHQEFNFLNSYLPTQKKRITFLICKWPMSNLELCFSMQNEIFLDMQVTCIEFENMFFHVSS